MNSVQATIISKSEDIYKHIKNEKIIAIDEAQFLDEKLYEVCKKLIKDGIDQTVLIVRSNKRANLFNKSIREKILFLEADLSSHEQVGC